jgi:hypothetical protein
MMKIAGNYIYNEKSYVEQDVQCTILSNGQMNSMSSTSMNLIGHFRFMSTLKTVSAMSWSGRLI